jgi:hypothetical protein
MLSVKHHIMARHAVWAVKLLTGVGTIPWMHLDRSLLRLLWGSGWHTMLPLFIGAQCAHDACHSSTRIAPMPAPLARIFHALHSLPAVDDVSEVQLQLVSWCASAPLIGNLWLRDTYDMVLGHDSSGDMVELLRCHTVGGLAHHLHFLLTLQQIINGNKAHGVLYQGNAACA